MASKKDAQIQTDVVKILVVPNPILDLVSPSSVKLLEQMFCENSLEYILLPSDIPIGIKYNCGIPQWNMNRNEWFRNEYINLQGLKHRLENGKLTVAEMAANKHVVLNPPPISAADLLDMRIDYRQGRAASILHTQEALLNLSCAVQIFRLDPHHKEANCILKLKNHAGINELCVLRVRHKH